MTTRKSRPPGSAESDRTHRHETRVRGSGAVAQGERAVAAGSRGIAVGTVNVVSGSADAAEAPMGEAYLGRVYRQTESLPLVGMDPLLTSRYPRARLGLEAIYTPLLTRSPVEREAGQGRLERQPQRLSALRQLEKNERLIL